MGLFSPKNLIAELKIGLLDKNKVFISIKNVPVGNNVEIFEKSQLPFIVYMFFLDRVLGNMSEKISAATLNSVHTWGTQFINKLSGISSQEVWEKKRPEFKTPNEWTLTNTEEDFATKADLKNLATKPELLKIKDEILNSNDKLAGKLDKILTEQIMQTSSYSRQDKEIVKIKDRVDRVEKNFNLKPISS